MCDLEGVATHSVSGTALSRWLWHDVGEVFATC